MNIGLVLKESLQSLSSNRMRSTLTILGIVIGVAAVIAMLAIGQGASSSITGSIGGLGSNLIFVYSYTTNQEVRNINPITMADVMTIQDPLQAPSIAGVAPSIQWPVTVTSHGRKASTTAEGVTASYAGVRNYQVTEGLFISDEQNSSQSMSVLLGPDIAMKLFDRKEGIVGETVRIEGQPYTVTGILESKGSGTMGSQDNLVIIPLSTLQARIAANNNQIGVIYISAKSPETVNSAIDEVSQILRSRHRTAAGMDDFTVMSQQSFINVAQSVTGVLTLFLGGVAAISLLVGGIGIMNIMLVTVTERTREIGLRKALGARKKDILIQFLTESSVLSFFGGILGIFFGWLIAFIVGKIAVMNNTPFQPSVTLNAVLLATLFSTCIGLFFGIYPANRAANLEPVEALRYQ